MGGVKSYLLVIGVAAVATFLLTFVVRRVATRTGLVQAPDDRRVHEKTTPLGGGAAMYLAFLATMAVASQLQQFEDVFAGSAPLGIILGASIIFAVGLVDDAREVSPPAKAAGQVLAGSALYFLGVSMFFLRVPFAEILVLSPDVQPLATVLWVAILANAVNFIDGLDGLAAGIVAIAAGSLLVYSERLSSAGLLTADNVGPLVAAIALGACLGFLPHNFHPARIFMGDSGSMLLALLMAAATITVGGGTDTEFSGQTYFFYAPAFIPLFILGVPIVDTVFAVFRRAMRRAGVAKADKDHLHHRLMKLGHGQRRSVLILWAWSAILSGFVLYPTFSNSGNHIIPFGVAALGVVLYTLFHPGIRQQPAEEEPADGLEADVGVPRAAASPTIASYDESAPQFAERWFGMRLGAPMDAFRALLPAGGSVVDVGCGPGRDTAWLRELGYEAAGFDLSAGMLAEARRRGVGPVAQADVRDLPVRSGSVDGVWCCASLLHLERADLAVALAEAARVCRAGGAMFLAVQEGEGTAEKPPGRRHFTFYREEELAAAVEAAGFVPVEVTVAASEGQDGVRWVNVIATRGPVQTVPLPAERDSGLRA